jgi:DinB superfamily
MDVVLNSLRTILKSQYHASLAMLRKTIEQCPDEIWMSGEHLNSFWQVAYHVLFYTHLYLQPNEAAFKPWAHHQADVQNQDGLTFPPDPKSDLPVGPQPYSKNQVLEYWNFVDQLVDTTVDSLDLMSPQSGFWWYKCSKLEHQFINLRHVQHHQAQLADRLRSAANISTRWVSF